ncbi:hypothetical protein [Afipia clevelandensis]|uniref:DUF1573 domain-containing protein n=1 Tax=Afipia clevelandensis ATCC 49720 TaxID=883079 RepID=K8P4Q7_9BRAD|nr:hypothetical protein [Afipia clevelandensis]EKS35704.1 hypothetical protein HMPREF9696_01916 [Afipia clevelandensis ATCC 49720]
MKTLIVSALAAILFSTAAASAAGPGDKVKITIEKWRKPGTNNVGTADISVTNDNDFTVKDIRVGCDYMSKTGGRKIETDQRLSVTVKAKTTKLFKKVKFPYIDQETAAGSCKVESAAQG